MNKELKLFLIIVCIKELSTSVITRLQKTLFIYTKEYDPNIFLYVPNNYGPNSFDLYDDVTFLKHNDFIKKHEKKGEYILTEKGISVYNNLLEKYSHEESILKQICDYANAVNNWLINYIYHIYPSYTSKSLIIEDVKRRMTDERKWDSTNRIELLRKKIQELKNK